MREKQTSIENKNVNIFVVCFTFALLAVVRLSVDMAASVYKRLSVMRSSNNSRKFCWMSSSWLFLLLSCILTFFILSL